MNKKHYSLIIVLILLLTFFYIGFTFGSYVTIKAVASVAGNFMDEQMIKEAIFKYNNHIAECYKPLNVSGLSNEILLNSSA